MGWVIAKSISNSSSARSGATSVPSSCWSLKYQRKLGRLLSRFVRDPAEVEDVTQEAFIKAYRALPSFRGDSAFYTWLYRIGINTAKNYLVALGRRAPTSTGFDNEEAECFEDAEQLRDSSTPESELMARKSRPR